MMKKMNKTLALAMGTTLISGLTSVAMATEVQGSVFEMTELSSGYMQLAAADTAKTDVAAKPTDAKTKAPEGKCAGDKPMAAHKSSEGKCGEGKCGGTMKAAEPAKTVTEAAKPAADSAKPAAAATTKASEGKCGEGKCGGTMKAAEPAKTEATKPAADSAKPADSTAVKK